MVGRRQLSRVALIAGTPGSQRPTRHTHEGRTTTSTLTVRLIGTLGACLLAACTATPVQTPTPSPGATATASTSASQTPNPTEVATDSPTPTAGPSAGPSPAPVVGQDWTAIALPLDAGSSSQLAKDVIAGGPGFVAVGSDYLRGYVWTSADGITWDLLPDARQWRRASIDRLVEWKGMLVAAGRHRSHAAFWTSSDGRDWQRLSDRPEFDFYSGRRGLYSSGTIQRLYVDGSDLVAEGTMEWSGGCASRPASDAWALCALASSTRRPWVTWRTSDGISWTRRQEMTDTIPEPPPPTIATLNSRWVRVGDHLGRAAAFVSPPVAAPAPPGGILRIAWTGATGGAIYPPPAVADGVVYVSSNDGLLYAFAAGCGNNGASCSPIWSGLGSYGFGPPVVANGVVYAVSGEGRLTAYSVGCGSGGAICVPLWVGPAHTASMESPAVADGVVYVGAEMSDSSLGNLVYAFDVGCINRGATCGPLWAGGIRGRQYQLGRAPVVADGVVYIVSNDGVLYAFDDSCGSGGAACSPLWTAATTDHIVTSNPVVGDGVVYVGSAGGDGNGRLYAFAVGCGSGGATCAPLWTAETGGTIGASPAVGDGEIYVTSTDGRLYAFAVGCGSGGATCAPLWTGEVGHGFPVRSGPTAADGVVYAGSSDGALNGFTVGCGSGGAACAPFRMGTAGAAINSAPVVAGGMLYVTADNGKLYAFALAP